jgi:hypothetical protein
MTETRITETVRNGVDTETMFATLDAITAQPEIARFRFRASNRWLGGAHTRSTIKDFDAACGEDTTRPEAFTLDAGEPAILLGTDTGNGFTEIRMHIRIADDAPPEKLRQIVQRGTDRSVVFDSIGNGVPISVDVLPA